MANGDIHLLGTLYTANAKKLMPTNPISTGNIPKYTAGQTIEIRSTDTEDAYKLRWVEIQVGGKRLLVADRNILHSVSWNDLELQGLVTGKTIEIDRKYYKIRLLTGGAERRQGGAGSSVEGGALPNEWDGWIGNEAGLHGLPTPTITDLDGLKRAEDIINEHNKLWNWYDVYSWTQEVYYHNGIYGISRGSYSAKQFAANALTERIDVRGWRPVLEEIPPINGKLKDQAPGTVINFAGSPWTILEPSTGYLFKNDSIAKREVGGANKNKFNPSEPSQIAYYLNNVYYGTLTDAEKTLIQSHDWGAGSVNTSEVGVATIEALREKERLSLVNAKIGLLSVSEWRKYSTSYSGNILRNPTSMFWLMTTDWAVTTRSWLMRLDGVLETLSISTQQDIKPSLYLDSNATIVNGIVTTNAAPTLTLNTPSNATLYENDTFLIDGTAKDTDNGNVVNVYYQIGVGTVRAIKTDISDGVTAIAFSRQLTFKAGMLHYNDTPVTGALSEGSAHTLKVWSEDNQGGKSAVAERTFYVVPNRTPALTVDPFADQSDMINNDTITLSGTSSDPDGNDVTVKYRVNEQMAVQIYSGVAGPWTFDLSLKSLKDGENTIVVEITDTYNFKSSRTIKLNKHANLTPLASSTQRYKIVPPSGSAQGVLLWIQRDADQEVTAEISMTTGTEQEQFVPLPLENSAPVGEDVEDYFKYRADAPAEHIALKFSWTGDKPITLISGALLQ